VLPLYVYAALAAAPADFSGTWVLDRQAGDSTDAVLAASGASWMER
jgi:hypothetical protein